MNPSPSTEIRRTRRNRIIVTLILLGSAVFFFGGGWVLRRQLSGTSNAMLNRKRLVLYESDPAAITKACRFIRDHRDTFRVDPRWHDAGQKELVSPDLSDPAMPRVIRALKPSYVLTGPDEVRVEMGDFAYHYGLSYSIRPTKYSMRKISPDLWFYCQDGIVPDPAESDAKR